MSREKVAIVVPSFGARIGEEVDGAQASGARHVLHDHGWLAGNVPAEMARKQPPIDVVAAAGAVADDQLDLLALVEFGDRIGACARECQA